MKKPLWTPSAERVNQAKMTDFTRYIAEKYNLSLSSYTDLYHWSIENRADFWKEIWHYCDIKSSQTYKHVLQNGDDMLNSHWFEGARLNFAENLLRRRDEGIALIFRGEDGRTERMSYRELYEAVAKVSSALRAFGIEKGDRIAGFLPNIKETVIAMLATTSLGAIWSSTSPDFGYQGVLDRFGQIQPRLIFTADGYFYKGKRIDSLERIEKLLPAIPSIEKVVVIPYTSKEPTIKHLNKATLWKDFWDETAREVTFEQLPFNHPVYILYSSGTTGVPKCIVHGAGGTLIQHLKEHQLHVDIKEGDRIFYFTTCGWMMWNWLVSALASGATIMLYDGSPFHPTPDTLFRYVEEERINIFGTSPKFLSSLENVGYRPKEHFDLSSLKTLLSTGAPLSPANFEFVYREIKEDLHLASISGGTDLISCFALGTPNRPVYSEEIQCRGLGMKVESYDLNGHPLPIGEKGELVCTASFPSQPVSFWNDDSREKYRKAYFSKFPNVWHHGDFIEITEHDGVIIYGRSDATLNPGGVRIGTAEIYRALKPLTFIEDSLVVGHNIDRDVEVVLFVKLKEGEELDNEKITEIKRTIRQNTSPRHVPSKIIAAPDIPYTISGKKVEIAVRQIIHGEPVLNKDALANPESLDFFAHLPDFSS